MLGSVISVLSSGVSGFFSAVGSVLGAIGGFFRRLFGGGNSTPAPITAEQAMVNIQPVALMDGPMLAVAGGIALSMLGVSTSPSVPSTSQLIVQTSALSSVQVHSISGPMANAAGGVALVSQGTPGSADHVTIVSPTGNAGRVRVSNFDVGDSVEVVSSQKPEDGYKSFFYKDARGNVVPNPRAFDALKAQTALLNSVRTAAPKRKLQTLQRAASISHE